MDENSRIGMKEGRQSIQSEKKLTNTENITQMQVIVAYSNLKNKTIANFSHFLL